jgi:hypothetical protein
MKSAGSVVVVLTVVCAVDGANFWEFLVGPRLGNGTEEAAAERGLTVSVSKTRKIAIGGRVPVPRSRPTFRDLRRIPTYLHIRCY